MFDSTWTFVSYTRRIKGTAERTEYLPVMCLLHSVCCPEAGFLTTGQHQLSIHVHTPQYLIIPAIDDPASPSRRLLLLSRALVDSPSCLVTGIYLLVSFCSGADEKSAFPNIKSRYQRPDVFHLHCAASANPDH
ncbi:uncharacterized protein UV8b_07974 [Ustilaginoidea virens]|uniref:Uncharacterized protein n=1 Tax=Ustilaginoidea virens TaxID=1159556 RepID=A0A8E5MKJ4_USTVR|nr:uncharacterized protein UV8b_07974 [Ustilaginoidea virens]QUC23733.1 hypothetical protein UV8b_07974 [Ustilaginoidea virens]